MGECIGFGELPAERVVAHGAGLATRVFHRGGQASGIKAEVFGAVLLRVFGDPVVGAARSVAID